MFIQMNFLEIFLKLKENYYTLSFKSISDYSFSSIKNNY